MARSCRRPKIKQVSKWPSRQEQLSLLLGQIFSPGAVLAGQLIGMGGALASQIKQRVEELEKRRPPLPQSQRLRLLRQRSSASREPPDAPAAS